MQQFDVSIEEYFTWLTKMEARLDAQHQIVTRDDSLDDDKVKVMQTQFKVSLQFYNLLYTLFSNDYVNLDADMF